MSGGKKVFSLLKLEGEDGPIYFVIEGLALQSDDDRELNSAMEYFYEEHSCPTNWLRNCVAVIEAGDEDPHGFLSHVRSIEVDKDADPDSEDGWKAVFPEAFP